jgi:hypothetical protein
VRGVVRRSNTSHVARLVAFGVMLPSMLAGCATVGLNNAPAPATTSTQTLEYYPFQVKGYQNSYPHRSILILIPTDSRDMAETGVSDPASLNGNPQIGVALDKDGNITERLYSAPLGPILQKGIVGSASEAGLTAFSSIDTTYKAGVKNANAYVLESKIKKCWVKKSRSADGRFGPVYRTVAEFRIEVAIYKPPFSVPFWSGTTSDTYYDPPVGSFGLGPEDEAGIYDEPGQVLSVAMTRTIAQIFERQDLRNLMLEDDIKAR